MFPDEFEPDLDRVRECLIEVEPGVLGFRATLIEGVTANLFKIAGLDHSPRMADEVGEGTSDLRLLRDCFSIEVEAEDFEGGPGMSDTYYTFRVRDPRVFARELRSVILAAAATVGKR